MSRFVTFVISGVSALALAPLTASLAPAQISPAAVAPAVSAAVTIAPVGFRTGNWCC